MTLREAPGGTDLDARYGRAPRRTRAIAVWTTAGVIVLAAVAWFVWARPIDSGQQEFWRDTGYRIVDDARIEVSFEATLPAGQAATCAVSAENEAHAIVGWVEVPIPASETAIRQFAVPLRTTDRPVTGLVYRCWLA